MLRRFTILFALILAAVMTIAPAAVAKQPIVGELDLDFTGPGNPTWTGTLTIDGTPYDIEFHKTGTGKQFDTRPESAKSSFFAEDWLVSLAGELVLSGYDRGVVSLANGKYRMSGRVVEADGPFDEDLIGRSVHISGVVIFDGGVPSTAPGVFRIN